MRLVCPNCEAKYEVPEDAIPETGRDVQCANCGHAWYQMRNRAAAAETVPVAAAVPPPPVPEPAPEPVAVPERVPEPEGMPVAAGTADPEPEVADTVASVDEVVETVAEEALATVADAARVIETAAAEAMPLPDATDDVPVEAPVGESDPAAMPESVPAPVAVSPEASVEPEAADGTGAAPLAVAGAAPVAYAVDDSVLAILREEAEREASARRAEATKPLEVQADLGIEAAMPVARKPGDGPASSPALTDHDADDKLSARRTRLPDVEEINSTLRPGEQAAEVDEAMPGPVGGRSSFRKGFLMVMTFAILGAALYVSADALSNAVPALAGILEAYVGFIDSLRLQLDGLMQSATVAINGA